MEREFSYSMDSESGSKREDLVPLRINSQTNQGAGRRVKRQDQDSQVGPLRNSCFSQRKHPGEPLGQVPVRSPVANLGSRGLSTNSSRFLSTSGSASLNGGP